MQHQPCLKTNWADDQARYAKMCYSDVPYLYTGRGLAEGRWPYADSGGRYEVTEYPVGISYLAWCAAQADPARPERAPDGRAAATATPARSGRCPGWPPR